MKNHEKQSGNNPKNRKYTVKTMASSDPEKVQKNFLLFHVTILVDENETWYFHTTSCCENALYCTFFDGKKIQSDLLDFRWFLRLESLLLHIFSLAISVE